MTNKPVSQSIHITGNVSGQIGIAGNNIRQHIEKSNDKQLTVSEILELFKRMETLIQGSDLSDVQKTKVTTYLETAKEEVRADEPDKDFAVKSLEKVAKIFESSNKIFKELQHMITPIVGWLS